MKYSKGVETYYAPADQLWYAFSCDGCIDWGKTEKQAVRRWQKVRKLLGKKP